jgi:hypothetical protein
VHDTVDLSLKLISRRFRPDVATMPTGAIIEASASMMAKGDGPGT